MRNTQIHVNKQEHTNTHTTYACTHERKVDQNLRLFQETGLRHKMRQLPLLATAVAINCLVIIVHALALILLKRYKQHHLSEKQVDLLIAIFFTELAYGFIDTGYKFSLLLDHDIFRIARNIFWVFSITSIILMYMMIMM